MTFKLVYFEFIEQGQSLTVLIKPLNKLATSLPMLITFIYVVHLSSTHVTCIL